MGLETLLAPLPLGIAAGLVVGKQFGIFGAVWGTVKLGLAAKPAGATWLQIYGVALLCGLGFTLSLFIVGLAFGGGGENEGKRGGSGREAGGERGSKVVGTSGVSGTLKTKKTH